MYFMRCVKIHRRQPAMSQVRNTLRSIIASAALLTPPAAAQDHRFEATPKAPARITCDRKSAFPRL